MEEFVTKLPSPTELQRRCRVVSMLDALVEGKPLTRGDIGTVYQPNWRPGDDLVKYTNGGGDEWSIIFSNTAGVFIRGFAHDSDLSTYNEDDYWPGLIGDLPEPFTSDLKNPDLYDHYDSAPQMTVCVWRGAADTAWRHGKPKPTQWGHQGDGGEGLFGPLVEWTASKELEWQYPAPGHVIAEVAVQRVMNQASLTDELVRAFHPAPDITALRAEATRIGY
ncbi:hypothetical protein BST43_23335 [Mycobacteroides saopaulense]|uniref:Uncharacterized protein n=1 Tax=Mycobacteroides saopaulense TaxID=1578165 RepID=A0A1X0IMN1_9MYCO|nr:hypothetical protein BST43_23335 [Mycobacteroides saopaulense]